MLLLVLLLRLFYVFHIFVLGFENFKLNLVYAQAEFGANFRLQAGEFSSLLRFFGIFGTDCSLVLLRVKG